MKDIAMSGDTMIQNIYNKLELHRFTNAANARGAADNAPLKPETRKMRLKLFGKRVANFFTFRSFRGRDWQSKKDLALYNSFHNALKTNFSETSNPQEVRAILNKHVVQSQRPTVAQARKVIHELELKDRRAKEQLGLLNDPSGRTGKNNPSYTGVVSSRNQPPLTEALYETLPAHSEGDGGYSTISDQPQEEELYATVRDTDQRRGINVGEGINNVSYTGEIASSPRERSRSVGSEPSAQNYTYATVKPKSQRGASRAAVDNSSDDMYSQPINQPRPGRTRAARQPKRGQMRNRPLPPEPTYDHIERDGRGIGGSNASEGAYATLRRDSAASDYETPVSTRSQSQQNVATDYETPVTTRGRSKSDSNIYETPIDGLRASQRRSDEAIYDVPPDAQKQENIYDKPWGQRSEALNRGIAANKAKKAKDATRAQAARSKPKSQNT